MSPRIKKILSVLAVTVGTTLAGPGLLKFMDWGHSWFTGIDSDKRSLVEMQNKKWQANRDCMTSDRPIEVTTIQNTVIRLLVCKKTGDVFFEQIGAGEIQPQISIWLDKEMLSSEKTALHSTLLASPLPLQIQQRSMRQVLCMLTAGERRMLVYEKLPDRCVSYFRDTFTNKISNVETINCDTAVRECSRPH